jgi:hypothetical protein
MEKRAQSCTCSSLVFVREWLEEIKFNIFAALCLDLTMVQERRSPRVLEIVYAAFPMNKGWVNQTVGLPVMKYTGLLVSKGGKLLYCNIKHQNNENVITHLGTICYSVCPPSRLFTLPLCGLLPLPVHTDQTTDCTCQTNKSIVEVRESKRRGGDGKIAEIGDQLQIDSRTFPRTNCQSTFP